MLQISDTPLNLLSQKENSFTSLTSIEGLHYRNPLEKDFEDEELTLEYKTLDYIGQVKQNINNIFIVSFNCRVIMLL